MKHSADRHADILLTVNENATAQCVMQARSPVDTEETWTHSALNIYKENRLAFNDVHLIVSHRQMCKPLEITCRKDNVVYISLSIFFCFMCPICPLNPCHFVCFSWLSPKVNSIASELIFKSTGLCFVFVFSFYSFLMKTIDQLYVIFPCQESISIYSSTIILFNLSYNFSALQDEVVFDKLGQDWYKKTIMKLFWMIYCK